MTADPIADMIGGQNPKRTRLQRQLDVLADWLARPDWTVQESAWLMAGVCPELSPHGGDQPGGWFLLPGVEGPAGGADLDFDRHMEWRIDRIRARLINLVPGGGEAAETPRKILEMARAAKLLPP